MSRNQLTAAILLPTALWLMPADLLAQERLLPSTETYYEVYSRDEKIGEINSLRTVSWQGTNPIITESHNTMISLASFWGNYSLQSKERVRLNETGVFYYEGQHLENNKASSIIAEKQDGALRIYIQGNKRRNLTIDVEQYDATSVDAHLIFIRSQQPSMTLRVFDFEDLKIKPTTYTYQGKQVVEAAHTVFKSFQITFTSKDKSAEQRLVEDATGIWVLEEKGKDSDGHYSVRLNQYKSH